LECSIIRILVPALLFYSLIGSSSGLSTVLETLDKTSNNSSTKIERDLLFKSRNEFNEKKYFLYAQHSNEEKTSTSTGLPPGKKMEQVVKIDTIKVYIGNLRARPSTKSSIIDKLKRGDKVTILEKKGEWVVVRLQDGRFGWVHQSLFQDKKRISKPKKVHLDKNKKKTPSRKVSPLPSVKTKNRATLQVHSGNIRARPSLSSKILFILRRGDVVSIQETMGDWFFVEGKDDQSGWVHQSLFTKSDSKKDSAIRFIQEIKSIEPEILSQQEEKVNFILNGYYQPETFILNEGNPRVVCDFINTHLGSSISRQIKVNGRIIQQIRIGIYKGFSPKVRVVVDLVPDQDYEVKTLFLRKEYLLVVRKK